MEFTKPIKFKDKTMNMTMEEVCIKFKGLIFKILQSWKGQYEIDDLEQIGYIGLINAYNTYNSENGCYFLNYAYTVISREFLRNHANNKNSNVIINSLNEVTNVDSSETERITLLKDESTNVEESAISNVHYDEIHKILKTYSEKEQKVILLYFFDNKTYREIAEVMGCTYGNISQFIKRILKKLQKELIKDK